jgi:hypothetical protein
MEGGNFIVSKIVQGMGMSHSPMMAMEGEDWQLYTNRDLNHQMLHDESGNPVTYNELDKQRESRYEREAEPEKLIALHEKMNKCFARLKDDVKRTQPDVMVVIGNDHPGEFFDGTNVPTLGVYYGDRIISADEKLRIKHLNRKSLLDPDSETFNRAAKLMGMDKNNVWPGSSRVGEHLIRSLTEQSFDVAALKEQSDPTKQGHGHGYGMVVTKLMDEDHLIPMVPIYLNTWPPNVISNSRCYDFGRAIRLAIESLPGNLRVSVVATGGLSHFVTDVGLDEYVLKALRSRSENDLRNLPEHRMKAGSAEIRNWVVLAGAVEHLELGWDQYEPVFRTPAGTGIGMTFARWS